MNSWKMEEMTATEIHKKREEGKIVVPKYQRGVVWKENQKKELIDSIKKGIPFGSILLYEDEEAKNYRLIDGLQRCTTIYEFISNPANFFNEDDIDDDSIQSIFDLINVVSSKDIIKEKLVETVISWIKSEHATMEDISGMQYYDCAEKISNEFPTLQGKEKQVVEIIKPMFKRYINICKTMANAKIPAIVIVGDEDILPIVFERINSKGSQLTKWQIYAATWSDETIKVSSDLERIILYNKDRYESMILDDNITLQDFDSISIERKSEVNTFELIFGFGKMISEDYPQLFSTSKKITEVNSVGFNLVNACLAFRNNEIKNLNRNLREIVGNDENINMFLKAIIECIKVVDKAIAITTKFKSNIRENTTPLHTEMQICSMIASVFINKYMRLQLNEKDLIEVRKINLEMPNEDWKSYKEKFLKNAIVNYLIDILQISWRGSGDKKLNYIIANPNYYTKETSKEEFNSVLNLWFENVKKERNEYRRVQVPKEADKVLLNIMYSNEFTAQDQIDESKYDIEHLATKGMMKKQLERFNGELRLPISSIGNLCLLPEEYNRAKGEETIYNSQECINNIQKIETKYSFTQKEDLEWIYDFDISKEKLESKYNNFINKRFEIIKKKLVNILY